VARANSARQLGNLEKARTLLLGTIDLFPGYAPAYYELAWIYRLTDDPIRAQNAIQQALNLHNSPPVNYYVRAGDIYAWSNELEQAQTAYEQASQLAPNDQRVIQGLESLGKSE
jgi:tetratricopeptide (TPR) repeat protein